MMLYLLKNHQLLQHSGRCLSFWLLSVKTLTSCQDLFKDGYILVVKRQKIDSWQQLIAIRYLEFFLVITGKSTKVDKFWVIKFFTFFQLQRKVSK